MGLVDRLFRSDEPSTSLEVVSPSPEPAAGHSLADAIAPEPRRPIYTRPPTPQEVYERGAWRTYADLPEGDVRAPASGASGVDGDSIYGLGDLLLGGPDLNPELSGRIKYQVYSEMRVDPCIRSALWMFKLPTRSAVWAHLPRDDSPQAKTVAAACDAQFGLDGKVGWMNLSHDEQLQQDLLYLDWGSMWGEIVWGDLIDWTDEEGVTHLIRPILQVAPRHPSTIYEIKTDKLSGLPTSISQDLPGARPIPGEKLHWIVNEREGASWYGTSIMRAMWYAWLAKRAMLVGAGIAWDRYAAGVPKVRYPGSGDKARAEAMGRDYRYHERAWIALEGPAPAPGEPGWEFEIVGTDGTFPDPVPMLRYHDEQILDSVLQTFNVLGTSSSGSRALAETQSDPYYLAVQSIAGTVASQRHRRLIRRFVDVNFGPDVPTPKLNVSKIQAKNVAVLAQALANLTSAGFSFADRETQNDVRDLLDLRQLPEPAADAIDGLPPDVGLEAQQLVPLEGGSVTVG